MAHLRNSGKHEHRTEDEITNAIARGDANVVTIKVQNRWAPTDVLDAGRIPTTPPRVPAARPSTSPSSLASSSALAPMLNLTKKRKLASLIQEVKGTQQTVDNARRMFECVVQAFAAKSDRLNGSMEQIEEHRSLHGLLY